MLRSFKIFLLFTLVLVGFTTLYAADKLTTVAVIDINAVYTAYFEQSAGVREYNRVRLEIQETVKALSQELVKLTESKLAAQKAKLNDDLVRIDQELQIKAKYLNDYRLVKNQELQNMKAALNSGDDFKRELDNAIEYVAISQGFTIVLQAGNDSTDVYWWSSEVDITTKVLEQLKRKL